MRRFATGTAGLLGLIIGLVAMLLLALVVAKPPSGGVLATPTDRDHWLAAHYVHHAAAAQNFEPGQLLRGSANGQLASAVQGHTVACERSPLPDVRT